MNKVEAVISKHKAYCGICKTALQWVGHYKVYDHLTYAVFPHYCTKCGQRYELKDSYNTTPVFVDMSPNI